MRELSLFTGAGGGLLASHLLGFQVVGAVEASSFRRQVLRARQEDGLLEDFPIHEDVCDFDGEPWRGRVDIVTGGFPCQPFSPAGKRRGEHDERNLWPDTARIIREVQPSFAFLENTATLTSNRYFGRILGDLAEGGFDAWWDCVPASAVGAPHQRDRVWILAVRRGVSGADLGELRLIGQRVREQRIEPWPAEPGDDGADRDTAQGGCGWQGQEPEVHKPGPITRRGGGRCALGSGEESPDLPGRLPNPHDLTDDDPGRHPGAVRGERSETAEVRGGRANPNAHKVGCGHARPGHTAVPVNGGMGPSELRVWTPESRPPFVAHGVADRVERLASTGDGQVPLVAAYAFVRLAEAALEMMIEQEEAA